MNAAEQQALKDHRRPSRHQRAKRVVDHAAEYQFLHQRTQQHHHKEVQRGLCGAQGTRFGLVGFHPRLGPGNEIDGDGRPECRGQTGGSRQHINGRLGAFLQSGEVRQRPPAAVCHKPQARQHHPVGHQQDLCLMVVHDLKHGGIGFRHGHALRKQRAAVEQHHGERRGGLGQQHQQDTDDDTHKRILSGCFHGNTSVPSFSFAIIIHLLQDLQSSAIMQILNFLQTGGDLL